MVVPNSTGIRHFSNQEIYLKRNTATHQDQLDRILIKETAMNQNRYLNRSLQWKMQKKIDG